MDFTSIFLDLSEAAASSFGLFDKIVLSFSVKLLLLFLGDFEIGMIEIYFPDSRDINKSLDYPGPISCNDPGFKIDGSLSCNESLETNDSLN